MSKTRILNIAINLTDWITVLRIIYAFVSKTFWSSVVTKNLLYPPHAISFAIDSGAESEAEHRNGMWGMKCKVHAEEQPHRHVLEHMFPMLMGLADNKA